MWECVRAPQWARHKPLPDDARAARSDFEALTSSGRNGYPFITKDSLGKRTLGQRYE